MRHRSLRSVDRRRLGKIERGRWIVGHVRSPEVEEEQGMEWKGKQGSRAEKGAQSLAYSIAAYHYAAMDGDEYKEEEDEKGENTQ